MEIRRLTLTAILMAAIGTGCTDKAREQFRDAPVEGRNKAPAEIISMPDGFSSVATKCSHGTRLFVAFKGDANRAAIAVAPGDPSCSEGTGGGR